MSKPSDSPGFKDLLEQWNTKLKEAGFEDIETPVGNDRALKRSGADYRFEVLIQNETLREAQADYYATIVEKIRRIEAEMKILALFADGVSQVEIQRQLGLEGHRCKVYIPINKWLKEWGLK